nr:HAT, C-terminal dimerization domain containing protein [Ipomoea batatas]
MVSTDKLIPNRDDMEKADLQCSAFHSREGFFGLSQAKSTVHKRTPGLTCSSSGCERNWSAFNQVHNKRRNRLTTTRMNALAYILYNKKLKDRHLKLKSLANEEDSLLIDELPSDDEWLVGENGEDDPHLSVDDFDVDVFEGEPSQATQPIAS